VHSTGPSAFPPRTNLPAFPPHPGLPSFQPRAKLRAAPPRARRGFWRDQLRVTWQLPAVLACLAALALLAHSWSWLTSTPPRVVRLSGSHYQMGLRHGRLLAAEIREIFQGYIEDGLVAREGFRLPSLIGSARRFERYIPGGLRAEMRGIADGSGVPYERILLLNTFADATLGRSPRFCSALAVQTREGLLVARNLDWEDHDIAHRAGVVFLLAGDGEQPVMSVGWPGLVGVVTGMNRAGVVITLNLAPAGDLVGDATPSLLRLRGALDTATSIDAAVSALGREPRTMGMNLLIASGREDRAVVLELSGRSQAVVPLVAGQVVTTNFYQALDIAGGVGGDRSSELTARLRRTGPRTSPADLRQALSAVAFPGPASGLATIQSVIFLPAQLTAEVAIGKLPAPSGRFFSVRLSP
jgi:predicted choloylglycine hydrolase